MCKRFLVSLLAVFSITCHQNLYAHNVKQDSENTEIKRKTAEEQQDRENWDDFMKAINDQEVKNNSDKEPGSHNKSSH